MNGLVASPWGPLLEQLPAVPNTAELILRDGIDGPSATIRYADRSPRVFVGGGLALRELLPEQDEGLVGAELLADANQLADVVAPAIGTVQATELVSWRPRRRAVVRVTTVAGDVHWLKLLDAKSYRRAQRAFGALGSALTPLQLAVPHTMLPGVGAYLSANSAGQSLRSLLAAAASTGAESSPRSPASSLWSAHLTRALLAIGYTRLLGDVNAQRLPRIDFESSRSATLGMLRKGSAVSPELLTLVEQITELRAPTAATEQAFVHGDLHDKQVFVSSDQVSLIDLEGLGVGDARVDFVNLAEHLHLRDLQHHGRDRGLADDLLARCSFDASDRDMLAFRAVIRARLCGVYALRPRWRDLVEKLRSEVQTLVEEIR
ncbi:MAG: hypothetical protein ACI89X_002008 [Planctomycetota bacterium]|jgi:hypothetical protein